MTKSQAPRSKSSQFFKDLNKEKVFSIMEERSQSSNEEISDHGCIKGRSFDYSEHRSCSHNSTTVALNNEAKETRKQDRISAMTDSILLHILSFLPTKDAITTSMLSPRWLHLWTSVSNLRFSCTFWGLIPQRKFVAFVDKTLLSHRHYNIKKFVVSFHYRDSFLFRVDTWVRIATWANVEELCLVLLSGYGFGDYHYLLPHFLYTNASMTTLKLTWCNVAPNGLISWKSLKSLLIGYTNLSEDVIQKILVGAPILESLELYSCWGFIRLDIGSASLRKLVVKDYGDLRTREDDSVLEISAPNLQSLGIVGKLDKKFRLMNIQSLDDCNLNFEQTICDDDCDNDFEEQRNMVGELLYMLRHVKKLTMGNWCIQVLSIMELKGMFSPMSECKCLILETYMECDVPGIVGLLESCLNLETLVIDMTSLYGLADLYKLECEVDEKCPENYCTSESRSEVDEKFLENYCTESGSSKGLLLHLKTLKIVNFVAQHREFSLVMPLVRFLLEKGRTLEKIVINARRGNHMECPREELLLVAQEFLSLPRISPHVIVMFSE